MNWPTGNDKVLQIGTGRFVRGFFAPLVTKPQSITVIQSRPNADGANAINDLDEGYHLWVRGIENSETMERVEKIRSFGNAFSFTSQWQEVLETAADPDYCLVVSNTTEKGLNLDPIDESYNIMPSPPASFPARLVCWLHRRFSTIGKPITLMPLELLEFNAERLRELVLQQATQWSFTDNPAFIQWLTEDCRWLSTLVDRICVDPVAPTPWADNDSLAVMTEPFRMLAIADDGGDRSVVPDHESVIWTQDLQPYFLQKVRLLNGLHTAIVARCLPMGFQHVIDVMNDAEQERWASALMFDELVPTLEAQGLQVKRFAEAVMERFRNPFFQHRLVDIAAGHETKLEVRLRPTYEEYQKLFGKVPPLLDAVLKLPLPKV